MTRTIDIDAGTLVVLSGLPGSGKSSLKRFAQGFRDLDRAWLSTDEIREQLFGEFRDLDSKGRLTENPADAGGTEFAILHQRLSARLSRGLTCIVDATSVTDADRRGYIAVAEALGVAYKVLILDTSVAECLEANSARRARGPELAIRAMHDRARVACKLTPTPSGTDLTRVLGVPLESVFPFEVVSRSDRLSLRLPELESEKYDVIGDVHGLLDELLVLLEKAGWRHEAGRLSHPQGRKLLFLGDLVDRGPQSIELLRLLRVAVKDGVAEVIMGNHEKKLVRFADAAQSRDASTLNWGSLSNAETGMRLLKQADCRQLVEFMRGLTHYRVLRTEDGYALAFVHANLKRFDAELTLAGDCIYGQFGWERGLDTDAMYEERYEGGLNKWTVFRGHIPQTSEQESIYSLERTPFEKGELVLLRLDQMLGHVRAGGSMREAFNQSVLTQRSEFSYAEAGAKWDMLKGLTALGRDKSVTAQACPDNLLRVFKYSKRTFWTNGWHTSPWLVKARGLVLDPAGGIVSHPFDKVFNLHENGAGDDLDEQETVVAVEKLNGFLGIVSAHPVAAGKLVVHTQGGFGGEFVGYINQYLLDPKVRGRVGSFLSRNGVTLLFEVIHPDDPHIVEYADEAQGLHLIGVRGNALTDQPWTEERVDAAALEMGLRRPSWTRVKFGEVKAMLRTTATEGFMVRRDDEQQAFLLKGKSTRYLVTKFLGRMSDKKASHMFESPHSFKKTVDEEFFPLVDALVARTTQAEFSALAQCNRVRFVREILEQLL